MPLLRVGLVTHNDPTDRRSWSGTYRSMYDALTGLVEVRLLPWRPTPPPRLERWVPRRRGKRNHDWATAGRHARAIEQALATEPVDVVLAVAAAGQVARLRAGVPVVYSSDTTFRLNLGQYRTFTGLSPAAIRQGERVERAAIRGAAALVYPSRWAADSAVRDYGAPADLVHVVPYGPNLAAPAVTPRSAGDPATVLFVGVDWERKGGAVAAAAVARLRETSARRLRFVVVGATPPAGSDTVDEAVRLDRRDPAQERRLAELFASTDALVLPSRADCSPIVLCEAMACGVPAVASDVGGIPELVTDGTTGRVLPADAPADAWAAAIDAVLGDRERLGAAARSAHETRFSWEAWARDVVDVLARAAAR